MLLSLSCEYILEKPKGIILIIAMKKCYDTFTNQSHTG